MTIPKSILVVSNGFGEDQIARKLIDAMHQLNSSIRFITVPLVGPGTAYSGHPAIRNHPNPSLPPSGGFLRSVSDIARDLGAGLLKTHRHHVHTIRSLQTSCLATIAVGDVYALWMGHGASLTLSHSPTPLGDDSSLYQPSGLLNSIQHKAMHLMSKLDKKHSGLSEPTQSSLFFLPTAKSDRFMPHSKLERYVIHKLATQTFTRDVETASSLASHGLNAQFLGNPMFDQLEPETLDTYAFPQEPLQVAVLPGSRDEALQNLVYIARTVSTMSTEANYTVALAPSLDLSMIQKTFNDTEWTVSADTLKHSQTGRILTLSRHFLSTVHSADLVIGLAGTANEQSAYLGKRVICFEGKGPQSTLKRFNEQAKLMGERILVLTETEDTLSNALDLIIQNPDPHRPLKRPAPQDSAQDITSYVLRKINLK